MNQRGKSDIEMGSYYSIRLLVTHPTMSVSEVTSALGMDPDDSWNAGERPFTNQMMWGYTSWTGGRRLFFEEVHDVLEWLNEEQVFVSRLLVSGGRLQVIVQLPGAINICDNLKFETMSLAVKLGITIGVEVFPNLVKSMPDDCNRPVIPSCSKQEVVLIPKAASFGVRFSEGAAVRGQVGNFVGTSWM